MAQRTLKESIPYVGVGLHTGKNVSMRVRSAEENRGIRFVRRDAPAGQGVIPALWHNVIDTRLSTVIGNEYGISVHSVEHLMAALCGCGIDNAVIELDGPEVPIMDGSAEPFVTLIEQAGVVRQSAPRKAIQIHKPVTVSDGDKFAVLMPDRIPRLTVEIDFESSVVGFQRLSLELVNGSFKHDVAPARTFGFMDEVEHLHKMGLARGGSLRNAIVIDGDRVMNEEGLRFHDEFVRHKALDCTGDLYLAGAPIVGHFFGHKPGHTLNNALMQQLFAEEDAWSYVTLDDMDRAPVWRRIAEAKLSSAIELARAWARKVA